MISPPGTRSFIRTCTYCRGVAGIPAEASLFPAVISKINPSSRASAPACVSRITTSNDDDTGVSPPSPGAIVPGADTSTPCNGCFWPSTAIAAACKVSGTVLSTVANILTS